MHMDPFLVKTNFKSSHQFASPLFSFSSSPTHFQTNTQDKAARHCSRLFASCQPSGLWQLGADPSVPPERNGFEYKEREKRKEPETGKRCIDSKNRGSMWGSKSRPHRF